jgi:hypothetical protein
LAIDLVIHIGAGVAVAEKMATSNYALVYGFCVFLGLSILHRIFLQRAFHTTLGKALVDLCLIRDDTGDPPTLWSLVKGWLYGVAITAATILDGGW